jgi:hypothetical protein
VKTGFYNVLYLLVSNTAILFCFVPFLFLIWKRMRKDKAYWMVGIYWLVTGLINLSYLGIDLAVATRTSALEAKLNFAYNILDTPVLLLFFFYAASGKKRKNHILLSMLLFTAFEGLLLAWKGYTFETSTMIIGGGLLLVLAYCVTGLVEYMRTMEHTAFENSMVCVYAALLFAYGSFSIIYIFTHIHRGDFIDKRDSFLLYYISILLAALVTTLGLWSYVIRKTKMGVSRYSSSSS